MGQDVLTELRNSPGGGEIPGGHISFLCEAGFIWLHALQEILEVQLGLGNASEETAVRLPQNPWSSSSEAGSYANY